MKSQAIPNKADFDACKFEHRKTWLRHGYRFSYPDSYGIYSLWSWTVSVQELCYLSSDTQSLHAGLDLVQRFAHERWVCLHLTCGEVTEVSFPTPQEGHIMVRVSLGSLHIQELQESPFGFFVEILYFLGLVFCRQQMVYARAGSFGGGVGALSVLYQKYMCSSSTIRSQLPSLLCTFTA